MRLRPLHIPWVLDPDAGYVEQTRLQLRSRVEACYIARAETHAP
jgi:hypothetical protein